MMTFPVKSGMSSKLNLLWGGKICPMIEETMPMFSLNSLRGGRECYTYQPFKQKTAAMVACSRDG